MLCVQSLGTDDMTEMAAIPEEAMQAAAQAAGLLQLPGGPLPRA